MDARCAVKLLRGNLNASTKWEGLVPRDWEISQMNTMPDDFGIGVVDIGTDVRVGAHLDVPSQPGF